MLTWPQGTYLCCVKLFRHGSKFLRTETVGEFSGFAMEKLNHKPLSDIRSQLYDRKSSVLRVHGMKEQLRVRRQEGLHEVSTGVREGRCLCKRRSSGRQMWRTLGFVSQSGGFFGKFDLFSLKFGFSCLSIYRWRISAEFVTIYVVAVYQTYVIQSLHLSARWRWQMPGWTSD